MARAWKCENCGYWYKPTHENYRLPCPRTTTTSAAQAHSASDRGTSRRKEEAAKREEKKKADEKERLRKEQSARDKARYQADLAEKKKREEQSTRDKAAARSASRTSIKEELTTAKRGRDASRGDRHGGDRRDRSLSRTSARSQSSQRSIPAAQDGPYLIDPLLAEGREDDDGRSAKSELSDTPSEKIKDLNANIQKFEKLLTEAKRMQMDEEVSRLEQQIARQRHGTTELKPVKDRRRIYGDAIDRLSEEIVEMREDFEDLRSKHDIDMARKEEKVAELRRKLLDLGCK